MLYEKTTKSYPPPPEKYSYPHLIRVWAFALLFVLVFAFTGCTDSTTPPPTEPANYQKRYGLYLPVERYENIDCEIDYYFTTPPLNNTHGIPYSSMPAWCLYHLEEKPDGDFVVTYNRETEYPYAKTLNICYGGLDNETFTYIYGSPSNINECYYSTYVVENFEVDHTAPNAPKRIWTIRAFVILIEENDRVLMREFLLRFVACCWHNENGDEIYEECAPLYSPDGTLLEENHYSQASDKLLHDRYISQSYTPLA